MSWLYRMVLSLALVAGIISGASAQHSATATGTASTTIQDPPGTILVKHSPFFGMEGNATGELRFSGSAAKITTSLSGGTGSVLAMGEPGYEVNVCVSFTSEMVSRDGTGGKLSGGVYLVNSREGSSNRTTAQINGSGGEMKFLISAMSPDASSTTHGSYSGSFDVIITYN
jgi:hypothetical protein